MRLKAAAATAAQPSLEDRSAPSTEYDNGTTWQAGHMICLVQHSSTVQRKCRAASRTAWAETDNSCSTTTMKPTLAFLSASLAVSLVTLIVTVAINATVANEPDNDLGRK